MQDIQTQARTKPLSNTASGKCIESQSGKANCQGRKERRRKKNSDKTNCTERNRN